MSALRRWLAPSACALIVLIALLTTSRDLGYARDEGFYFAAARSYQGWFSLLATDRRAALRREAVDRAWSVNHEHPPLMKSLFALSHRAFGEARHGERAMFSEPGTSFRFPTMALSALMAFVVCAWSAARARGRSGNLAGGAPTLAASVEAAAASGCERRLRSGNFAGVVAALSLAFMPQLFYHQHLACFDAPITALFVLAFFAYDRTLSTRGPLWPVLTGVAFGLALLTKHNSWFLPIAFTAHAALRAALAWRSKSPLGPAVARSGWALAAMFTIGPLMMVALWPWLWFDTQARFAEYVRFHLQHEFYNMEFLGSNYFEPPMPRTYAPLMTLATVPTITLLVALVGAAVLAAGALRDVRARDDAALERWSTPLLFVLGVGVSYGPWISSSTPIFGGTKHWMPAYPFIALLAGEGFAHVRARLEAAASLLPAQVAKAIGPVVALCLLVSPVHAALHAHPWALSAYVPLVGGPRGAATLGLNRTFWGYTSGALVDYLNRELPRGGSVYPHDTASQAWDMLIEDGRLRKDIRAVWRAEDADIVLYQHEQHMQGQEYQAWVVLGTTQPDVVLGLDGVPVIWAYKNPTSRRTR